MFYKNKLEIVSECKNVLLTCPTCGYLARDREDLISIELEKSCTECLINFKNVMGDAWSNGERPDREVARKTMNILIEEV